MDKNKLIVAAVTGVVGAAAFTAGYFSKKLKDGKAPVITNVKKTAPRTRKPASSTK